MGTLPTKMHASRNQALVEAFAAELRTCREALGVSQEALARLAGVNRTFVGRLELAQNQPSISVLFHLSDALGLTPEAFITKIRARLKSMSKAGK